MKRWFAMLVLGAVAGLWRPTAAQAHPMGNFAICHYTRLYADKNGLALRYILDLAEIPTVAEKQVMDRNRDGVVDDSEKAAYLAAKIPELLAGLTLVINDQVLPLQPASHAASFAPGAGGLETLKIQLDFQVALPAAGDTYTVVFRDRNYATRAGWKEIVGVSGPGVALRDSSVPTTDRSQELTVYPLEVIPPQQTEARFTVMPDAAVTQATAADEPHPAASASSTTPQDAFTQAIAYQELGPRIQAAGLLIAFIFGMLHALSPGHGKAMVAAYLVGTRGTAGQAILLGIVVTITHTLGVFALGLVTLLASQYVLPEQLYPILSVLSGLTICGVGLWLLYHRCRRLLRYLRQGQQASDPSRAQPHHHHHHHHMPEGPVTPRALIALGISGGLIPCPSALVVLLAAVALDRLLYGMLLISGFSLGLAATLVVLGLLVVYARRWLDRVPRSTLLLRTLPIASGMTITLIGFGLIVRVLGQVTP
jgi:ABC-type nickel/cobalt efflux system permease component RcnA